MDPTSIISLVTSIISRVFPDKTEAQKLQFTKELQQALIEANLAQGQLEINKAEASNPGRTWPTWRECLGYLCVLAFGWVYLIQPVLVFIIIASGHPKPDLPELDVAQLMMLLFTMLGTVGMRTYEKVKGVTKKD